MKIDLLNITSKLVGNKDIIESFLNNINKNLDGDTWMIEGPKGIGKATLVNLIASKLLNLEYKSGSPLFHPDLILLTKDDKKKNIAVDDIRNMKRLFFKTSFSGDFRIAIIDSINDLNLYGHNAILKIIEEPPKGSFIFIINHQTSFIPATIKSRCKLLKFNTIHNNEILSILKKMNYSFNEEDLNFYAIIANGSIGDAIYYINNDSLTFYKELCIYLTNIKSFDYNQTKKIISLITDNKNQLSILFFKLITILFHKVIKRKFLNNTEYLIKEESLLIEQLIKLYNFETLYYIKDMIEQSYNNFVNFSADLQITTYTLLLGMHKRINV